MIPIFIINLDRAQDRWAALQHSAQGLDVDLRRIAAVDGKALTAENRLFFDASTFKRRNGRQALPGELGCYLSHLSALQAVVDSGAASAVIAEDDIALSTDAISRLDALLALELDCDVIKLMNHRNKGFVSFAHTAAGDSVGCSFVGPNGSAAAYLVSRSAAQTMLKTMATMSLPFDVELERAWARGQSLTSVRDNLFAFSKHRSQSAIATRKEYRAQKHIWYQRIPTALFRTVEVLRRFAYAVSIVLRSTKK
ncbi:MAG: glycosyltransferase family 25 protein [Ahrensia sp.]